MINKANQQYSYLFDNPNTLKAKIAEAYPEMEKKEIDKLADEFQKVAKPTRITADDIETGYDIYISIPEEKIKKIFDRLSQAKRG